MLKINLKIWIVTIICCTVSCKVVKNYDNHATPKYNETTEHNTPIHSASCLRCGSSSSITLPQARVMNELENSDYFERKLNVKRQIAETTQLTAETPNVARCIPTPQVVSLIDDTDSNFSYSVYCTRVNRCSGCCPEAKHSCQPSSIKVRKFKVQKRSPYGLEYVDRFVDEHLSCQCVCSVKRESCTDKQEYDADECRCDCKDTEEKRNCHYNELKSWDHDKCRCTCETKFRDCTTPQIFDENTCTCR